MNSRSRDPLVFGFINCSIAWGLVIGVFLAYLPEYVSGFYEFRSMESAIYWIACLGVPPIVGLVGGIALDQSLANSESRKETLAVGWKLVAWSAVALAVLSAMGGNPVY